MKEHDCFLNRLTLYRHVVERRGRKVSERDRKEALIGEWCPSREQSEDPVDGVVRNAVWVIVGIWLSFHDQCLEISYGTL